MGVINEIRLMPAAIKVLLGIAAALAVAVLVSLIPTSTYSDAAGTQEVSADAAFDDARLGRSDAAACGMLRRALLAVAHGTALDHALERHAFLPWPQGQPTSSVRGVFNAFRAASSAQADYMGGGATQQEAADAFNSAFAAYSQICEGAPSRA